MVSPVRSQVILQAPTTNYEEYDGEYRFDEEKYQRFKELYESGITDTNELCDILGAEQWEIGKFESYRFKMIRREALNHPEGWWQSVGRYKK